MSRTGKTQKSTLLVGLGRDIPLLVRFVEGDRLKVDSDE